MTTRPSALARMRLEHLGFVKFARILELSDDELATMAFLMSREPLVLDSAQREQFARAVLA